MCVCVCVLHGINMVSGMWWCQIVMMMGTGGSASEFSKLTVSGFSKPHIWCMFLSNTKCKFLHFCPGEEQMPNMPFWNITEIQCNGVMMSVNWMLQFPSNCASKYKNCYPRVAFFGGTYFAGICNLQIGVNFTFPLHLKKDSSWEPALGQYAVNWKNIFIDLFDVTSPFNIIITVTSLA